MLHKHAGTAFDDSALELKIKRTIVCLSSQWGHTIFIKTNPCSHFLNQVLFGETQQEVPHVDFSH
jgi:hypothetical protein